MTRYAMAAPRREISCLSLWWLAVVVLGLGLSGCGWPGIDVYSEPQQSGLSEEGETLEYRVTIELEPGALDEARRGFFSVRGSVRGSGGEVPVFEVSGGDPLSVGGRVDELGTFDFVWDWELPAECDEDCEVSLPVVLEVIESRGGTAGVDWRAGYVIEVPARIEREKVDLEGFVTVDQVR